MLTKTNATSLKADINITPIIDVMLVLLLIFMISASSMINKFNVSLPKSSLSSKQNSANINIDIYITKSGSALINSKYLSNQALRGYLSKLSKKDSYKFIISADKRVPYERVVEVMDFINQYGYKSISLSTSIG